MEQYLPAEVSMNWFDTNVPNIEFAKTLPAGMVLNVSKQ